MDFLNFPAILVAAVSALVVGFIWYHPKVFGNAWMKAAGMTEEQIKGGNMAKIFIMALIFAFFLASVALPSYEAFMADYGNAFRTYKHGALHGILAGIFVALPIIGTNALFERKRAKYILINSGYWIVTMGIMGAIICGWV